MERSALFKPFSQILGQEKAVGFLMRVIDRDKIPHAYLFTGISGVGKSTTAVAFSQAINCHKPGPGGGCGECPSCRQIISGNFPDLIHLGPDGKNIKIEQIRELNRQLNFKPVVGRYRVSILDQVELMTEEAVNSFLKTLEEPPPGNVLILKVVEPLDLPDTIVSRCQKVPFRPLIHDIIKRCLIDEAEADSDEAELIASLSEGSLGKALQIQGGNYLKERQDFLFKISGLPNLPKEEAVEMVLEYSGKAKKGGHETADGGLSLFELLGIWKSWYRDLIIAKVEGQVDLMMNIDFRKKIENHSKKADMNGLIDSFFLVDEAQRDMIRNPNIGLMMENMVIEIKKSLDKAANEGD